MIKVKKKLEMKLKKIALPPNAVIQAGNDIHGTCLADTGKSIMNSNWTEKRISR